MPKTCECCYYGYQTNGRTFYKAKARNTEQELQRYAEYLNAQREEPLTIVPQVNWATGEICRHCYDHIKTWLERPPNDDTPDLTFWRDAYYSNVSCLFGCGARSVDLTRITPEFRRKLLVEYKVSMRLKLCHKAN